MNNSSDDDVSDSELHNALLAVFEAVKTSDCNKLIECLSQYKTKLYSNLLNNALSSQLWALELALYRGDIEAASILALYQLNNGDITKEELSGEINLSKDEWSQCLSSAVLRMKQTYRKRLRAPSDYVEHLYNEGAHGQLRARNWHSFHDVVSNHYSKILTPFDVTHPAAFMALVRFDDNFRIISPEGYTLPMHVVMSKDKCRQHKLAMLEFIEHFDAELFQVPSGPEGLVPSVYCLKTNSVFLFQRIPGLNNFSMFRSTAGKSIMDYCRNIHLKMLHENARKRIYTNTDGALNTFLVRNAVGRSDYKYHDDLAIEAIETLYHNGKGDQLKELSEKLTEYDEPLGTYMLQIGYRLEGLNKFKRNLPVVEKEYFMQEPQTSFEFMNLPREMLELIIATLQGRDVMCLFMTTKQMYKTFDSFNRPEMWRRGLNNTKCVFEGDFVPDDIKKHVIDVERSRRNWQHGGKFHEKILCEIQAWSHLRDHVYIDDHWMCTTDYKSNDMWWINLNTAQVLDVKMDHENYFQYIRQCVVDARSMASPLIAVYSNLGQLYYGRLGLDTIKHHVIQMHKSDATCTFVYAQSTNKIVASQMLEVIDLTTQQVVTSNTDGSVIQQAMSNVYNRRLSIGRDTLSNVKIFDENMCMVQQMHLDHSKLIGMIDEYTLAMDLEWKGIVLYDIRNLAASNYQLLIKKYNGTVSVDPRCQRMLVPTSPHNMVVQIDLRTRKWERVWPAIKTDYYNPFPLINDRYMLQVNKHGYMKITARDLNV